MGFAQGSSRDSMVIQLIFKAGGVYGSWNLRASGLGFRGSRVRRLRFCIFGLRTSGSGIEV